MDCRRVRFFRLVRVYVLDDGDEDRRSRWMRDALERYRFRRRIQSLSRVLEPILSTEHRLVVALRNANLSNSKMSYSDDVSAWR